MKSKRTIIIAYITLFICAFVYMLLAREKHDAFAGIFLVVLSLPWSLAVIPIGLAIAWICPPEFMNTHSDSVGLVVILIGGVINLYVIHRIFYAIERRKQKK